MYIFRTFSHSIRSHFVYFVVEKVSVSRVSMLSFCDLAGSERVSKTQTVGTRQKEAGNINTSLLVLGRLVIDVLILKGTVIVASRDSKMNKIFLFNSSQTHYFKLWLLFENDLPNSSADKMRGNC